MKTIRFMVVVPAMMVVWIAGVACCGLGWEHWEDCAARQWEHLREWAVK